MAYFHLNIKLRREENQTTIIRLLQHPTDSRRNISEPVSTVLRFRRYRITSENMNDPGLCLGNRKTYCGKLWCFQVSDSNCENSI